MDPSILQPGPVKPAKWWILVVLLAGGTGALGTVAIAGRGTYDVAPFKVRLQALPAPLGETALELQPVEGVIEVPARAEAGTHASPLLAKATIVGVTSPPVRSDLVLLDSPYELASFLGQDGKDAIRSFAVLLAGLSIGGGALGGLVLSFGRWRRILGGALAGVLTFGGIGVLMQQTYDTSEFRKTCFVVDERCVGALPEVVDPLPTVVPS